MTDNKKMVFFGKGSGSGDGASWGSITGTISNQTDLMTELNKKADTSEIRKVIDIMDMTTEELVDFYNNYATLLKQNTYVVNGYTFTTFTNNTVLILEYNPQFKDVVVGAENGTIDVTVGIVNIYQDGTKQTSTLDFNIPKTDSTETLTFIDSNNVSTTVVVYTQPQN